MCLVQLAGAAALLGAPCCHAIPSKLVITERTGGDFAIMASHADHLVADTDERAARIIGPEDGAVSLGATVKFDARLIGTAIDPEAAR